MDFFEVTKTMVQVVLGVGLLSLAVVTAQGILRGFTRTSLLHYGYAGLPSMLFVVHLSLRPGGPPASVFGIAYWSVVLGSGYFVVTPLVDAVLFSILRTPEWDPGKRRRAVLRTAEVIIGVMIVVLVATLLSMFALTNAML